VKPSDRKGNGIEKTPLKEAESMPVSSSEEPSKGSAVKKVADLRTAVEGGTYRVEARKVADKIVKDALREIRNRHR
jgi:anti-sigma28 factor (negative regulator of flagellin synthesis)